MIISFFTNGATNFEDFSSVNTTNCCLFDLQQTASKYRKLLALYLRQHFFKEFQQPKKFNIILLYPIEQLPESRYHDDVF